MKLNGPVRRDPFGANENAQYSLKERKPQKVVIGNGTQFQQQQIKTNDQIGIEHQAIIVLIVEQQYK